MPSALRRGVAARPCRPCARDRRSLTLAVSSSCVTRFALLVTIQQFGDQSQTAAGILASLVLSPLVFVGAALLYVDQAARVKVV